MSAFAVPISLAPRLQALTELPDARFDALISAADADRIPNSVHTIAADAASAGGLPVSDMEAVVDGILSLLGDEQVSRRGIDAVIDEAVANTDMDAESRPHAAGRLKRIAAVSAIRLLQRSFEAGRATGHLFRSCRVLTDARLVDDPDDETLVGGLCVIHKLKIDYEDSGGRLSSFYVTLSRDDLTDIVVAAGRAVVESIKTEQTLASVTDVAELR